MGSTQQILQIYAKAPEQGKVKTRMIPALGAQGALQLHLQLTEYTLNNLTATDAWQSQLWVSGVMDHPFFLSCQQRYSISRHVQSGAALGEKMLNSAAWACEDTPAHVVVVGADCVSVDQAYITQAFHVLKTQDVVLGPAEDGGYVLIGFSKVVPGMLDQVAWGTPSVLQQTVDSLDAAGLTYGLLGEKWDVDEPEDIARWEALRKGESLLTGV